MRKAPATERGDAATLVLCGHGTRGPGGALERHATAIRARHLFTDVLVCSLYGGPDLARILDAVATPEFRVVPWLMCAGDTMDRLAGAIDAHPAAGRVVLGEPVGARADVAGLAADLAEAACLRHGWKPAEIGLLLVAHGSGRNTISAETTKRHAARIAATGRFAATGTAFLDEPPGPADALARLGTPNRVAVGLFAERSLHGEADVPRLLSRSRDVLYAGPIGPLPAFADVIVAAARDARHPSRDAA